MIEMRIAFLIVKHIQLGGGIEKYTYELGRRLVQRGHEVTVYSLKHYADFPGATSATTGELDGMRIVGVPSLHFSFAEKLSGSAFAALRLLFSKKYDVVHLHSVAAGAFAVIPRFLRGTPVVLQMHGIEWQRSRWSGLGQTFLWLLEKIALKTANAHTAVSRVQCDFYAGVAGRSTGRDKIKMRYIPTGCEVKEYVEPQEILKVLSGGVPAGLEPKKYILFASRLVAEKGPQYLIPAYRQLRDTDYKLVIAGDAKDNEAFKRKLLDLAENDPRIVFPGFASGRLLAELFHHAAVYVHPSELEGLSIALLEGLGYGIPVLASDIPENVEAVAETGYYSLIK